MCQVAKQTTPKFLLYQHGCPFSAFPMTFQGFHAISCFREHKHVQTLQKHGSFLLLPFFSCAAVYFSRFLEGGYFAFAKSPTVFCACSGLSIFRRISVFSEQLLSVRWYKVFAAQHRSPLEVYPANRMLVCSGICDLEGQDSVFISQFFWCCRSSDLIRALMDAERAYQPVLAWVIFISRLPFAHITLPSKSNALNISDSSCSVPTALSTPLLI